jgi:U3 small nucleolar ribonucleoprotein protein IMP3
MGVLGTGGGGMGKLNNHRRHLPGEGYRCEVGFSLFPFVVFERAALLTEAARNMEDFITWIGSSKIKQNILKYRDKLDDFDLL